MAERKRLIELMNILNINISAPTLVSALSEVLDRSRQSAPEPPSVNAVKLTASLEMAKKPLTLTLTLTLP